MNPIQRFKFEIAAAVAAVLLCALPAAAQDETALRTFFEGKRVKLKIDMPSTSDGVDIRPGEPKPLDYKAYGDRLKKSGPAIRAGEPARVALVKLKKNLIEVQLAGVDRHDYACQSVCPVYPFNVRYSRVPKDITPQTVMAALAEYIEFFPNGPNLATAPLPVVVATPFPAPGPIATPYKGMMRAAAEQAFGKPVESGSRREGALTVATLVFIYADQRISAEFVEDVLIRYTIKSR